MEFLLVHLFLILLKIDARTRLVYLRIVFDFAKKVVLTRALSLFG